MESIELQPQLLLKANPMIKYKSIVLIISLIINLICQASEHDHKSKFYNIPCPGKDFPTFFEKFSNDENIQRSYTMTPLRKLTLDITAYPEPTVSIKKLKYFELSFPIIPLKNERKINLLETSIIKINTTEAKSKLFKPDTGYQIEYYFIYKNNCWMLINIEDWGT